MGIVSIPGLLKRGEMYYYRRVIMPRELAAVIGKTEIVVSLKTRDLAVAIERIAIEKKKADVLIANAKKIAASPEQAALAWKRNKLGEDMRSRLQWERNDDTLDAESLGLDDRFQAVSERLRRGGLSRSEHARMVQELDALKTLLARTKGDFEAPTEENPRLTVVVQKWAKDTKASPRITAEWSRAFDRLIAVVGRIVGLNSAGSPRTASRLGWATECNLARELVGRRVSDCWATEPEIARPVRGRSQRVVGR